MTRLNDTELLILNTALQHGEYAVDAAQYAEDPKRTKALLSLLRGKMIERTTYRPGLPVWKEEGDQRVSLTLSARGLDTLGAAAPVQVAPKPGKAPVAKSQPAEPAATKAAAAKRVPGKTSKSKPIAKAAPKEKPKASARPLKTKATKPGSSAAVLVRAGSKSATMIALLKGKSGASIAELIKATGWQQHSIRGAISGLLKKKLGLEVQSTKTDDGERRYRIEG